MTLHKALAIITLSMSVPVLAQQYIYCPPAVSCTSNLASSCQISGVPGNSGWSITRTYANLPLEGGTYYFGMVTNVGLSVGQEKSPECHYYLQGKLYDNNNNLISVGVTGSSYINANIEQNKGQWEQTGDGVYSCGRQAQLYDPKACPMTISRENPQQVYP
jgi:hypothetical protein